MPGKHVLRHVTVKGVVGHVHGHVLKHMLEHMPGHVPQNRQPLVYCRGDLLKLSECFRPMMVPMEVTRMKRRRRSMHTGIEAGARVSPCVQ